MNLLPGDALFLREENTVYVRPMPFGVELNMDQKGENIRGPDTFIVLYSGKVDGIEYSTGTFVMSSCTLRSFWIYSPDSLTYEHVPGHAR
jgi:hypothetical protein